MSDTWMLTINGRDHYLSGCGAFMNEIDVCDIAHSLSITNRFNGHTSRPYSVAEHSLLVADLAAHDGKSALIQFLCLVHDAHEAYTGDQSSPSKNAIGLGWANFEHRHADRVRRQLGVITGFTVHKHLVDTYDQIALATERRDLTHFDAARHRAWPGLDDPGTKFTPVDWVNLNALPRVNAAWSHWKNAFLERFAQLRQQVRDEENARLVPFHHSV